MSDVSLKDWILAARPKTLTAAFIPVICGHLIVNFYTTTHVSISVTALALLCAILIQVGTNFFNDVIDFRNGVDGDQRSGPRRLLQMGKVSETRMRAAAHACFLSAFILGFPLVLKGGLVVLAIGIISIIIGYSYSAPPLKLAYRGIAEPFVVLFFGSVAVVGVEWLHTRSFSALGVITGLQVGMLATVLLVINNIRDHKEDAERGKLTTVARFGRAFGLGEIVFLYSTTLLLTCCTRVVNLPLTALSMLWIIPAFFVIKDIFCGLSASSLNRTLGFAALAHLIFGISRCLQLLW